MAFVTLQNIKDVLNNQVAFNGVTGAIFSEKKQVIFAAAMEQFGYARNVWASVNQWDSLGLTIKGAKGKGICVKVFISANSADQDENKEYKKALAAYLKIKAHNEKAKGKKQYNPYVQVKGGLILNCYYYNVAECKAKGDQDVNVTINVPNELKGASNSLLALNYAPDYQCDLVEYSEPVAPVKTENKDQGVTIDATCKVIDDNKDQIIADLKAENEQLKAIIAQLKNGLDALAKTASI